MILTWTEDPTTTISIDWPRLDQQPEQLHYREKGEICWKEIHNLPVYNVPAYPSE